MGRKAQGVMRVFSLLLCMRQGRDREHLACIYRYSQLWRQGLACVLHPPQHLAAQGMRQFKQIDHARGARTGLLRQGNSCKVAFFPACPKPTSLKALR